jgi:hypothetical protein
MLTGYPFTARFTPEASEQTTVRIETFCTPANPAASVLNRLVMRRKFRSVVDGLLRGFARSLSSATPSPKPEPATPTRQATARSGRGDVPARRERAAAGSRTGQRTAARRPTARTTLSAHAA